MILSDIANVICTKVNQNETEDLAACKLFVARRYEMIWNDQLWKDAVIEWTYTLPAAGTPYTPTSLWLPTKQNLILPAQFERVLALRTDTRKLNIQSPEIYYRADYNAFLNAGMMVDYQLLPPAVWDFDQAAVLSLQAQAGDDGKAASADVLQSDGMTTARDAIVMSGAAPNTQTVDTILRLDSFTKVTTTKNVVLAAGPVLVNGGAAAHTFTFYDVNNVLLQTSVLPVGAGVLVPLTVNSIARHGGLAAGGLTPTTGWIWTAQDFANAYGFIIAISFGGQTILTLQAADQAAGRRQRVRLVGLPDVPAPQIRVLGKAKCPQLTSDQDSTLLTGVDNCLLAIGEYDMLKRERQYGKAQSCLTEFTTLLEQLKGIEVVQQAQNRRIIPEDGYGNPYDLWSHPPLTF